jgi:hypothetical protein
MTSTSNFIKIYLYSLEEMKKKEKKNKIYWKKCILLKHKENVQLIVYIKCILNIS